MVLEIRNAKTGFPELKSTCQQSYAPSGGSRGESLPFPAYRGLSTFLASDHGIVTLLLLSCSIMSDSSRPNGLAHQAPLASTISHSLHPSSTNKDLSLTNLTQVIQGHLPITGSLIILKIPFAL
ncbi:unnamed protein product [Rangifer tarandus platyrhynchus]|uniref:Uncharacterized protein n=2 Tax=Rangifer tarandus platyrhynchus TaxID=3082113 RepID=A0AC59YPQ6_RANTA|nr:unnamed protein product [Rangifer tarandus platyrhynchus]